MKLTAALIGAAFLLGAVAGCGGNHIARQARLYNGLGTAGVVVGGETESEFRYVGYEFVGEDRGLFACVSSPMGIISWNMRDSCPP